MPIYEYQCTKCKDQVEVMQKITDRPLRKCKKCAGRLEKLISRSSFQLKGGGWYDSGYTKSGGSDAKKKTKKKASDSGDKKPASSSDKKAASA